LHGKVSSALLRDSSWSAAAFKGTTGMFRENGISVWWGESGQKKNIGIRKACMDCYERGDGLCLPGGIKWQR
jgi:hypothetical protein